jgi:RNA polymerase sigma-70 factor (ECF subfamily)
MGPVERAISRERHSSLHAALSTLPQSDHELLTLRHLKGLTVQQAAAVLNLSEEAAKTRHRRALERLRVILQASRPFSQNT